MKDYKKACDLYKKGKEENDEGDQAFYNQVRLKLKKMLEDVDD